MCYGTSSLFLKEMSRWNLNGSNLPQLWMVALHSFLLVNREFDLWKLCMATVARPLLQLS